MMKLAEITVQNVVDELEQSREKLRDLSVRDCKTNLYNASYIMTLLDTVVEESERTKQPLQIAMLDLDSFKKYNDHYGHIAGDSVLIAISDILTESVRNTDIIGRFGGDEFIMIFPNSELSTTEKLIRRLQATFTKKLHITNKLIFLDDLLTKQCIWPKKRDAIKPVPILTMNIILTA
ncbi:GGDEF domain-containing protein [Sporomusa ovata]|nr:GGDEF domain-containing protein [Sporomusa ovata]